MIMGRLVEAQIPRVAMVYENRGLQGLGEERRPLTDRERLAGKVAVGLSIAAFLGFMLWAYASKRDRVPAY